MQLDMNEKSESKDVLKLVSDVPTETKSRRKDGSIKTFLLYIPRDLHRELKSDASYSDMTLQDYLVYVLRKVTDLRTEEIRTRSVRNITKA